jgi:hypothetical protein
MAFPAIAAAAGSGSSAGTISGIVSGVSQLGNAGGTSSSGIGGKIFGDMFGDPLGSGIKMYRAKKDREEEQRRYEAQQRMQREVFDLNKAQILQQMAEQNSKTQWIRDFRNAMLKGTK